MFEGKKTNDDLRKFDLKRKLLQDKETAIYCSRKKRKSKNCAVKSIIRSVIWNLQIKKVNETFLYLSWKMYKYSGLDICVCHYHSCIREIQTQRRNNIFAKLNMFTSHIGQSSHGSVNSYPFPKKEGVTKEVFYSFDEKYNITKHSKLFVCLFPIKLWWKLGQP